MRSKKIQDTRYKIQIYRIIDVNTNRAVEGLRVMEEVVRFVLEDRKTTLELKEIRGKLRGIIDKLIDNEIHFQRRKALKDVGKELYTFGEAKRKTILDIFLANAKRVQEALRVLEEFSKLINPRSGKALKDIRFKVYDLEQKIFYVLTRRLKLDFDLYVITDPTVPAGRQVRDHVKVARAAVKGGVKIIQLRDKTASKKQILKWSKQISKLAKRSNATFIVNDYLDIAREVDADGVHLGQEDLDKITIARAKRRLGEDKIIGVSTHSLAQAIKAEREGADYISLGPIFSTPSKPGMKALGLGLLRKVIKRVNIPVTAIGGINETNIYSVKKTGCQRAAVIRAVVCAKDIKTAAVRLREILPKLNQ